MVEPRKVEPILFSPKGKASGRAKKGTTDLKMKAKTRTWSNVVKGLEEDELETTDSVEKSDSNES